MKPKVQRKLQGDGKREPSSTQVSVLHAPVPASSEAHSLV